jgi:hypothetical protein
MSLINTLIRTGSRRQLARRLRVGHTTVTDALKDPSKIGRRILQSIAYNFPDIDAELCDFLRDQERIRLAALDRQEDTAA